MPIERKNIFGSSYILTINNKLFPIMANLLKQTELTFEEYKNHMLNLPIQNYLTVNVSKAVIEQYKDRYVPIESLSSTQYNESLEIYQK